MNSPPRAASRGRRGREGRRRRGAGVRRGRPRLHPERWCDDGHRVAAGLGAGRARRLGVVSAPRAFSWRTRIRGSATARCGEVNPSRRRQVPAWSPVDGRPADDARGTRRGRTRRPSERALGTHRGRGSGGDGVGCHIALCRARRDDHGAVGAEGERPRALGRQRRSQTMKSKSAQLRPRARPRSSRVHRPFPQTLNPPVPGSPATPSASHEVAAPRCG